MNEMSAPAETGTALVTSAGLDEATAKRVVKAIVLGQVPHIRVEY